MVGVFIPAQPFPAIAFDTFQISSTLQLFLLDGLAIALGVFTYSKRVMMTAVDDLGHLSPTAAFIAVTSQSIVRLFASPGNPIVQA